MDALDLATACPPDADEHPRHQGLRTAGRLAAYEATAIGAAFAGWALVDATLSGLARLTGRTRRLVRRFAA